MQLTDTKCLCVPPCRRITTKNLDSTLDAYLLKDLAMIPIDMKDMFACVCAMYRSIYVPIPKPCLSGSFLFNTENVLWRGAQHNFPDLVDWMWNWFGQSWWKGHQPQMHINRIMYKCRGIGWHVRGRHSRSSQVALVPSARIPSGVPRRPHHHEQLDSDIRHNARHTCDQNFPVIQHFNA